MAEVGVFHQKEPLTDSQTCILSNSCSQRYDAWVAKSELYNVLPKYGKSIYHIYKCLCQYRGQIIEEKPNKFWCQILVEKNHDLLRDIDTTLSFQKQKLTVQRELLHSKYKDNYLIEFIVYK